MHEIQKKIRELQDPQKKLILQRFFKTGHGEYAEGDLFLGVTVPQIRWIVRDCKERLVKALVPILKSDYHEERMAALLSLVAIYKKGDEKEREDIFEIYKSHTKYINNWDLIDLTAEHIIGDYLKDKPKTLLTEFARSSSLWERRIAILSTFKYIKSGSYDETFRIAKILLNDKEDLIHKGVGWMLREVGKRCSQKAEEEFLQRHYKNMPRTMLRYAIERFEESLRKRYLAGTI